MAMSPYVVRSILVVCIIDHCSVGFPCVLRLSKLKKNLLGFEDEIWLYLQPYIINTYMMKGEQKIFIKAFITLLYPSNKNSRTSADYIDHLKNIRNYVKEQGKTIHPRCNSISRSTDSVDKGMDGTRYLRLFPQRPLTEDH